MTNEISDKEKTCALVVVNPDTRRESAEEPPPRDYI